MGCYLLLEDGGALLAEDGGHLLQDDCEPTTGGRRRRGAAAPIPLPQNEDDELITWIQTHHPDPLRRH